MRLLRLKQAVVLSMILLSCTSDSLYAQQAFQGLMEGVYPMRLVVQESSPSAILSISSPSNEIKFIGGCDLDQCKYRGVDTSMTLFFEKTTEGIKGRVQNGDGTKKSFMLEQVDLDRPFATSCNNNFWLRSYHDVTEKHQLTLATLPGKQAKGTLYLSELGTSFSVSGNLTNGNLSLNLLSPANRSLGTIAGKLNDKSNASKLTITLELEGSTSSIELHLSEEMALNCMQADGLYDIVFPALAGTSYASLPVKLWKSMSMQEEGFAHAWFEPTLFNDFMLSGWMHVEGPTGRRSESINLLRDKNQKFKQGKLLGGKRSKNELTARYKDLAIAQHPLHADEDFQTWAQQSEFSEYTFTTEGMNLSSVRHPMYGQLEVIVPWRELPKNEGLPNWLTDSK